MIDMIGAFCNCSSSTQGRSRVNLRLEKTLARNKDMSLRPLQESYQDIRSAWKSEGPPGGRGVGNCAREAWGLAAGASSLAHRSPPRPSHSRRDAARRRRHEFGADRIADRCGEDAVDLRLGGRIEMPAAHLINRIQLAGMACAPQRRGDALIEHPANRQMDHSLVE